MGLILKNISTLLTLAPAAAKGARRVTAADLGILQNQTVVIDKGQIQWVGDFKKLPKEIAKRVAQKKAKIQDMNGMTVMPGLVECHTHLVFAGDRAAEFEMRNQGASYQEIAAAGGGILSTMKKTRAASLKELTEIGQKRANKFVQQGVTTLEVKSGYALDLKNEVKVLQAGLNIKGPHIVSTFLGAHALPPEFKTYESYLDYVAAEVLPVVKKKKLAERVDIFIEKGFFPADVSEKYLAKAKALGFEVMAHADQLSLSGGSDVAIKVGALSGDHLLQVTEKEIKGLADSEVTCVLLPTADLYMRCKYPPARAMIDAGARVALATDFNPGTSPTQDVSLVGLLARLEMKMSLPEVIAAYTIGAAFALRREKTVGSIEVGKNADLLCTARDWKTLFYNAGESFADQVFIRGKSVFRHKQ